MSSYMMTSLIGRYEQSFHVLHEQTKQLNGVDKFYKGVHSSDAEKSLFHENVSLDSDAILPSVPVWIPRDKISDSVVTRSDSDESDSPGSSYVPGSPSPSPGPECETIREDNLIFDVPEPRGLPPIPEYEYFSGPLQLAEWARLKKGTYKELEFEWSMLCQECTDCWDRSDLQLAAELGKTLLERNKELENSLKHQQAIIDDQAQEIEYLTKQTAALREVNDSRLRIYEQLEISITELEKNNIRLNEESISDKSRIKSLCSTVDILEVRCEELQRCVDEARSQERIRKRREKRRSSQKEEATSRKASGQDTVCQNGFGTTSDEDESFGDIPEVNLDGEGRDSPGMGARESGYSSTCADSLGHLNTDSENDIRSQSPDEGSLVRKSTTVKDALLDEAHIEALLSEEEVARLSGEVAWLKEETRHGDRKVGELEEQVKSLVAENSQLASGLEAATRQSERCRPTRSSTVEEEVLALEEVSEGILCKKCLGLTEDSPSSQNHSPTELVQMGASELISQAIQSVTTWTKEDTREPKDKSNLIYLQSGVQEDVGTSLSANNQEDLVSKLDDQYRHLIDKYEALLSLHNQSSSERYNSEASINHQLSLQEELRMSGQFENSDDENHDDTNHVAQMENGDEQIMTEDAFGFSEPSHMLNTNKPFCGRLTSSSMSKAEEYSEAETYSSGFSEGIDFKYCNKQTQTDVGIECHANIINEFKDCKKDENPLDLNKDANYMDDHFQTTPKYKVIFKEIFQVLKQAHGDTDGFKEEKQEQNQTKPSKHSTNEKPSIKESANYNVWKNKTYKEKICHKDKGFEWDSNEYPSLASASVARLKILEESYANVLRKGIKQNYD